MSLQQDGALPAQEAVDNPPPGPVDTTMTANCPADTVPFQGTATTSGKLAPGFAGATINLTYTRPGTQGSFERTTTTDANGDWSHTIEPHARIAERAGHLDGAGTVRGRRRS